MEVYNHNGDRIRLKINQNIIPGGEGAIYENIDERELCAKIFRPEKITNELHDKIKFMMKNCPEDIMMPNHRSIAWPMDILYEDIKKTKFLGYMMPFMGTKKFKQSHNYYDSEYIIKKFKGAFTWKHMFMTAYNIASTVASIHKNGHCIGDLREKNILVAQNALITLIDCDSFQVKDKNGKIFYTRVGIPDYQPPELMNIDFKNNDYDRYYSDLFALGIIIFKFLMLGTHPYQAKGPLVDDTGSPGAKIMKGYFPYINIKGVEPPDHAPPYDIIPPNIKTLFYRCFVLGYNAPNQRPTANEWFKALEKEI